jgi:hippurate hydrolase
MAAVANITITVLGKGAHGAQPHNGVDPIVVSGAIVAALQSVVARNVDPTESAVVTIGEIKGGSAFNVIPRDVTMRGTARWFSPAVGDILETAVGRIVRSIAEAYGASAEVDFARTYPAVINDETSTALAKAAAEAVVGEARVVPLLRPTMGGEDFSFMLNAKPGNYIMLGAGKTDKDPQVHSPDYDFNDDLLPIGASYWATLTEQLLPMSSR